MHILHALHHRYRDPQHTKRYHSMLVTQITHKILGNVYDRLVYRNQIIWLGGCPSYQRFMIYLHKNKLIHQIQDKLTDYHISVAIKDIRFQ